MPQKTIFWISLLNYEKNYSVRLFVDELYVSRSVILNDLDNLNELLERFHIKFLVKKNKGIVIDGNEFEIRQAITFFQNKRLFKTDYLKAPREIDPRLSDRAMDIYHRVLRTGCLQYCSDTAVY